MIDNHNPQQYFDKLISATLHTVSNPEVKVMAGHFCTAFARLNKKGLFLQTLSLAVKFANLKPQSFIRVIDIGSDSPKVVKYEKDLKDHNCGFACLSL